MSTVDERRFLRRFNELAACGATANGGVNRQCLSMAATEAHATVLGWFRKPGYDIRADRIGNLFITRAGAEANAPPVMIGSHLDSQPTGGKYDGTLGVLGGAEVLASLDDAKVTTPRPLQLVIWMNEEGCRFSPVTMGSAAYAGALALDQALASTDPSGAVFETELGPFLSRLGVEPGPKPPIPHCYLELHIEQGPILEAEGCTVGIVSGVQGIRQYRVDVTGQEGHAGTTPQSLRKDAFAAARGLIARLEAEFADSEELTRFTVGRCDVFPAAPNTVPGRTSFTIDLRHPDSATLARHDSTLRCACAADRSPCAMAITDLIAMSPVRFDDRMIADIERIAARLDFPSRRLLSGATHDAANLARLCKAAMIFIPCRNGVSHREDEYASPGDMIAGTAVLKEAALAFAGRAQRTEEMDRADAGER